jgi:branched-chain amino acid transport system substrate-binding protein
MNGGAQSPLLGETGGYLFNTIPLIYKESEALATYLAGEGTKTAAVIHTSDDGGVAAYEAFKEAFEAAGGTVSAVESAKYQSTDFRSQLTKLKGSDAEVLLVGAFGLDSNNIISQTREVGWDVQLVNTSWVAIPEVLSNSAAEGLIHTSIPFTPTDEFVAAYEEAYGEKPTSGYIGNYYDGIRVFAQAYEKASNGGETDPDGEAIMAAVKEIGTFESCYGSELRFDDQLVAERPIGVSKITGGASEVITDEV